MSFSQYLQETYGLNEVRGFGGRISPEGTTYSSDYGDESLGRKRRRKAKLIAQELRNDDPTMSINASWKAGQEKAGVRSRYATGSREQQPDSYFSFQNARGQESGLSMSPKQRARLAADRAERRGQGKRANKIRARMGIGEEVNYVLSHLIDEGYTDNYESAEIIYESMSDEWLYQILDEAPVEIMSVTSPEGKRRKGKRVFSGRSSLNRQNFRKLAALQRRQRENPRAMGTRSARRQAEQEFSNNLEKSIERMNAIDNIDARHGEDNDHDYTSYNSRSGYREVPTDYRARRRRASGR